MIALVRWGILLTCLCAATSVPASDAPDAVTAGHKALSRWTKYPWYDAGHDALQPVKVEVPPPPERLENSGSLGDLLRVLVWTLLALALAALAYLLLRAFAARRHEASPVAEVADGDADRIESLPFPVAAGRLDLLAEARRHYEAGNYGAAIVYLFSFQLVQLDRRQIIRLARGKTNRQYLREVGPRISLRKLVEQTMVAFEDVFFGNRQLHRDRFESCWTRLEEFETLAAAEGLGG